MGYDSPSAALALGGVPGLSDLGLDGMGTPVPGPLGGGVRGDEDERKRRLQQVLDILKVCCGRAATIINDANASANRQTKGVSASLELRD